MREFTYYLFNFFVVLGPLVVLTLRRGEVRLRTRHLVYAIGSVGSAFALWDIWAAREGHWGFNSEYITGPYVFSVPIEEYLFFVTVPFAMLFVWEVVRLHFQDKPIYRAYELASMILGTVGGLVLAAAHWDKGYTRSVALALIGTTLLLYKAKLLLSRRFWIFQGLHLALFSLANSVLTALPVITYGESSYIGFRIGTIPIEDFIFSFALVNMAVVLYQRISHEK